MVGSQHGRRDLTTAWPPPAPRATPPPGMRSLRVLALLTLSVGLAAVGADGQDPDRAPGVGAFRAEKEAAVVELAARASADFENRDALLAACGCAVHSCGYDFGGGGRCLDFAFQREGDYGCKDALCPVEKFDFSRSYVRTPPYVDIERVEDFKDVAEEICIYQALDDDNFFQRIMSSEVGNESFIGWVYLGTRSGVVRVWPGLPAISFGTNLCPEFDPRLRPWYLEAPTGPKNLAVVVEAPGTNQAWENSKAMIDFLLQTSSYVDFLNIVIFGQEASSLGGKSLLKANGRNVERFSQALDDVADQTSTVVDYGTALEVAFQLFNVSEEQSEDKSIKDCRKAIIFIANSPDCREVDPSSCSSAEETDVGGGRARLLDKLQKMQAAASGSTTIFTYRVGGGLDPGLLQQIACQNGGAYGSVTEDVIPARSMAGFFQFADVAFPNGDPMWTEPYIDAWGIGEISTISMPLFAANSTGPKCLLGVAAIDVPTAELDPSISISDIIAEVEDSKQCLPSNGTIESCILQVSRGDAHQCQEPLDSSECYNFTNVAGESSLYFRTDAMSFEAAETLCTSLGGSLPQIDSPEEQQFLSGIVPPDRSWMGLTKMDNSSEWEWVSGTAVTQSAQLWLSGEAPTGEEMGSCAVMDAGSTFQNVRVADCSSQFNVICEGISVEGCEGAVLPVSWEELTKSLNAQETALKCSTVEACDGLSGASPKPRNTLCPIGDVENFEENGCCRCDFENDR